ncbi:CHASE3 domain-containing protein [Actinosynnema pretiosum subsp. pretiosum]|uniref:histidine kinase n=1 Tax=Actinosynnema pretiosum subsp. pretiosum TaxID=103721 RepID=A0AA45L535_9PSEU|nr:Phytochrome, two-component sensor histidine kinase [Actinosynnema pretiosum subsp. pretiosum]QUF03629.1 CHASE3 domain-containing protein [Actinosynnema pretiosum subsp. pretiosum]
MNYRDRWPASRLLAAAVAILILVSGGAVTAIGFALNSLDKQRAVVLDQIGPARRLVIEMDAALVNQETGLRGYALSASSDFLTPYTRGIEAEENAARGVTSALRTTRPDLLARLAETRGIAQDWREQYAERLIAQVTENGQPQPGVGGTTVGKELFDQVRRSVNQLQADMTRDVDAARAELDLTADRLLWLCIALGTLLAVIIAGVAVVLHRILIRPLATLAAQVREVSEGDYGHAVETSGPRETVMLAEDVDAMRRRIVSDLKDLQRSNAELEQFAYVASHDLQEPLRKVASFCQLLERRYSGQLDARGEQYIQFAVDGAKRMQVLINDLLAFSRVGRITREQTMVDCGELVDQVVDSYSEVITKTSAVVTHSRLPTVRGESSLLSGVFGNLISNGLKFHGEQPPRIDIGVERTGKFWTFTVTDNGIGIDPEYAERIFVIFQRLHHRDDYPGTGIGLSMCRKIVEYHGGTIWLETAESPGTTFKFTLPVVEETGDKR